MALASDGSLFTWGDGSHGQLGHSQLQTMAAAVLGNQPISLPNAQKINRLDPQNLTNENRCVIWSLSLSHKRFWCSCSRSAGA